MSASCAEGRDDAVLLGLRGVAYGLLALVCLAPLIACAGILLGGGEGHDLFGARQARLLTSTLVMACGAAVIAVLVGGGVGVALGYYRPRYAEVLLAVSALPLFMPPYLIAMSWVDVFGMQAWLLPGPLNAAGPPLLSLRGHGASAFVLGMCHAPMVTVAVLAALRRYDHGLDEAARLSAGEWGVLRSILFPHLRAAIGLGAAVVFVLAMLNLSVPSLLQAPVYAVEIYTWFNMQASPRMAVLQSIPLSLIALPLLLVGLAALRRLMVDGDSAPRRNVPLAHARAARRMAGVAACCCMGLTVAVPVGALVWRAWPLTALPGAWVTAQDELIVSVVLAGGTALVCVALAVLLVALPMRGAMLIGLLPVAVAGPVFAVGFIAFWNHTGLRGAVYDGPLALLLVCTGKYVGWAMLGVWLAARGVPAEQREAARNLGAGRARAMWRVALPAMGPSIFGTALLVFVLVLGEVDAVLLTAPPGTTPLSVRVYALMHYGSTGETAALGLLIMALILPCALGSVWMFARHRVRG